MSLRIITIRLAACIPRIPVYEIFWSYHLASSISSRTLSKTVPAASEPFRDGESYNKPLAPKVYNSEILSSRSIKMPKL